MISDVNVRKHIRKRTGNVTRRPELRRRPDTRRMFGDFTKRKTEWEDMRKVDFTRFSEEKQDAIFTLPTKRVPANASVFDSLFEYGHDQLEWLVYRGNKTYYVNTEGHDYARYGFEIVGFPRFE